MKLRWLVGIAFLIVLVGASGCQQSPEASEKSPDTFATTYYLAEEGRSISISGDSDGMPSEQSEYELKINNGTEPWQDEYYILLVDSDSIVEEVYYEQFDIPSRGGIQRPVTVVFPEGYEGALGLCVLIPERASVITALSVGVDNAIATGWPDVTKLIQPTEGEKTPGVQNIP